MAQANAKTYIEKALAKVKKWNPHEPQFLQAVTEVFTSLEPVLDRYPKYMEAKIFERMMEPERSPTRVHRASKACGTRPGRPIQHPIGAISPMFPRGQCRPTSSL